MLFWCVLAGGHLKKPGLIERVPTALSNTRVGIQSGQNHTSAAYEALALFLTPVRTYRDREAIIAIVSVVPHACALDMLSHTCTHCTAPLLLVSICQIIYREGCTQTCLPAPALLWQYITYPAHIHIISCHMTRGLLTGAGAAVRLYAATCILLSSSPSPLLLTRHLSPHITVTGHR